MIRRGTAIAPVCAVLIAAVAGCSAPNVSPERADFLLLTIDTLRGDRWGCLGSPEARTPHLDRVARGGLFAFEGRAPAPVTLPSHTTMMTGLPPVAHGVHDNGIFHLAEDQGTTLAQAMKAGGWATAAFVSAYPLIRSSGLDRGFDRYDANLSGSSRELGQMRQRTAAATVDRVEDWLAGERGSPPDSTAPWFLWVHVFDPHAEYEPPPEWAAVHPGDAYQGEVSFVDAEAGRLLRLLDDRRPGRRRWTVVTADHGEGLYEHGEATHGSLIHASTIRVPIVVRSGAYEPELEAAPTGLERIPATILSLAGLSPELNPGAAPSMDAPPGPVHTETLYPFYNFGWSGLRAREEDGWRLVAGPSARLFRMDTDPGESYDLSGQHPDVVERMQAALEREWEQRAAQAFTNQERELSDRETEALRALGYVGGDAGSEITDDTFRAGADPHERQGLVDRINGALTLLHNGRAEEAYERFRALVALDEHNPFAYRFLGQAALEAGRFAEARDAFRTALSLGPGPDLVYRDLARAELGLGEVDAARETLLQAIALNPASADARNRLGGIYVSERRFELAREQFLAAVDHRPRFVEAWANLGIVSQVLGRKQDAADAWRKVVELEDSGPLRRNAERNLRALEEGGTEP
ncbi:MAG TPA: sulfatase-like hydrolase/transferase [bacterium]|nr:sulfatase-like hydrolase/transferase [bacterium]